MPHSHRESIADLMTPDQARKLRTDHDARVKSLSRMKVPALRDIERAHLAEQGRERVYGGPASKDEFIRAILETEYPVNRLNESIHVLYHVTGIGGSSACEWCHPHNGGGCDCSLGPVTLADHTGSAIEKILGA